MRWRPRPGCWPRSCPSRSLISRGTACTCTSVSGMTTSAELFADPSDARGLGMSSLGYSFIGGLLEHAQALSAIACPTVNSYKRLSSAAARFGSGLVAGLRHLWRERPHPHAARARRRPGRGPLHRRLGQPVPHAGRARRRPAWTASTAQGRPGRPVRAQPARVDRAPRPLERGLVSMPVTLWQAAGHLEADGVSARGTGQDARRRLPRLLRHDQACRGSFVAREVTPWEIERYLSAV